MNPFTAYPDKKSLYPGLSLISLYIPLRDGVQLAADIYLPKGLPRDEKIPTILMQSRYWRAIEPRPPFHWFIDDLGDYASPYRKFKPFFVRRGYALINIDVRGTGASTGVWHYPWEPATIQDASQVLDWIVAQPWSNGRVGGMGVSYLGQTAELLTATQHPSVRAIAPFFNHPDPYTDIAFPGGLYNQRYINAWSTMDEYLDRNEIPPVFGRLARWMAHGVRPVDGKVGKLKLQEAILQHQNNGNAFSIGRGITFRDETTTELGVSVDDLAVHHYRDIISHNQIPSFGQASWMDAGTGEAAIRRFLTFPGANHAIIGAWNHGGLMQADPFTNPRTPITPPWQDLWRQLLRFFDAHLKDVDNGIQSEKVLYYYLLGAETWQQSATWPPSGVNPTTWYIGPDGSLQPEAPQETLGEDHYTVDYLASSGENNRWWEMSSVLGWTVEYPNRASAASHLLCYTSPPLEQDIEILGSPVATFYIETSEPDCSFYLYLEDVAPDGRVFYLSEGLMRAIHRKVSKESPPYTLQIPYHSFRQSDVLPMERGEIAEINLGLLPVAIRMRKGHRIRLSLAGHDEGTFPRYPAQGTPEWRVMRNAKHASRIILPIRPA
jgi:putative CocE/NonD family hydrolase